MNARGNATVVVILILAGISLFAFLLTGPKATEKSSEAVIDYNLVQSHIARLRLIDAAIAALTLIAIIVASTSLVHGLWSAFPARRCFYPAAALTILGLLLLTLLWVSRFWPPAADLFAYRPSALRTTQAQPYLFTINAWVAGLVCIPFIIGLLAYVVHRIAATVTSPIARASNT